MTLKQYLLNALMLSLALASAPLFAAESLAVKDSRMILPREQAELQALQIWASSPQAVALVGSANIATHDTAFTERLNNLFGDPEMQDFMRDERLMVRDGNRFGHSLRTGAERSMYNEMPSTVAPRNAYQGYAQRRVAYLHDRTHWLAMILQRHPGVTASPVNHDGIITLTFERFPAYKVELSLYNWPLWIQGPFYGEHRFFLHDIAAPLYAQTINEFIAKEGLRYIDATPQWLYHLPGTLEMPLDDHHYVVVARNITYDPEMEITTFADLATSQETGVIASSMYTAKEVEDLLVELTQVITHTGIWELGSLEHVNIALYRDAEDHLRAAFTNIRRPALGGSEAVRFYRRYSATESRAPFVPESLDPAVTDSPLIQLHDVPEEIIVRGKAGMGGVDGDGNRSGLVKLLLDARDRRAAPPVAASSDDAAAASSGVSGK